MAKDPAFLFYPSDFLTGTMFMNNEQIGIYIRLLCSQHQHGGIIDKISFNTLVGENLIIKSKFIETETGFYNERLTSEMDKRNKKSNNMSETAKEVWKIRKIQLNNKSKQNEYNCITDVNKNDTIVIQTVNRNEDINKDKDIINIWFEDLKNSSQLEKICSNNKFDINQVRLVKIPEFKKYAELDYPNYSKFVSHFKNWVIKNPPKDLNAPLKMVY
jgi:uncharacterized protein YdaU (DUF1376 family)